MKCSAAVSFFFKDGKLVIVRFINKHNHSSQKKNRAPPAEIKKADTEMIQFFDKDKLKMKVARIYGLDYYKDVEEPDVRINAEMYRNATTSLVDQLKHK